MTNLLKDFKTVVIFGAAIQQRVAKTAYSFHKLGANLTIYAEENAVSGEFDNYMKGVSFSQIPVIKSKLRRTPLGKDRWVFISKVLEELAQKDERVLIIARDVNYGYIVGRIIKSIHATNLFFIVDVADNYDLLYDSYKNIILRTAYWVGFSFITRKAFKYADAVTTVCSINKPRLERKFKKQLNGKPVVVLKNLPIEFKYINNEKKQDNTLVYVGKIDETSRDPMYIIEKLAQMPEFELHFYSSQKKETITKIRDYSKLLSVDNRVVFHDRVPYDQLAMEISKYQFGLVPHKRSLITDYTLPNKMYDYKSSGIISIMSSCPSLIEENKEYSFGLVYSKENDDLVRIVDDAKNYFLDTSIHIPNWEEGFLSAITQLI